MKLNEYYDSAYEKENARELSALKEEALSFSKGLFHYVRESKDKFLSEVDWSSLRILEAGAGRGGLGLHLARLGASVTLLDFSPIALEQGEKIFSTENLNVKTVLGDVTSPELSLEEKYDIIVDSHLLHCLTEDPERSSYYAFIKEHLSDRGIFVAETMVHRKKLYIPEGFHFDEKNVLWQFMGQMIPIRRILDSLDLEDEIKKTGLEIAYFYYYGQFGFIPHQNFLEVPAEILPASVRMILKAQ